MPSYGQKIQSIASDRLPPIDCLHESGKGQDTFPNLYNAYLQLF